MTQSFSKDFDRALVLAAIVHDGVARKGTVIPYIIHPVHVATLLLRHGYGPELVLAGLLHDVLEDIDYGDGRLQLAVSKTFPHAGFPAELVDEETFRTCFRAFFVKEFGPAVTHLVEAVSEPKNDGGPRRSWLERRTVILERLAAEHADVVALKAADALHNVRSIVEDLTHHGATVMGRFKASPAETLWYYQQITRLVSRRLGDAPIAQELSAAVDELAASLSG